MENRIWYFLTHVIVSKEEFVSTFRQDKINLEKQLSLSQEVVFGKT
jgi:hypothetical protein